MLKVKIKPSKLDGNGLFATSDIKSEETIIHIKGEVLKLSIFFKLPKKVKDNTYRFSENEYLSPKGELGDFLNHSCNPNSRIVKRGKRLYLVAVKNIRTNSELFIDYTTILAKDDYWIMPCKCRAKNCRKKIKRYSALPKKVLASMQAKNLIPSYILAIDNN